MSRSFKAFKKSTYQAIKYKNYFEVYDQLFNSYINKKIVFVEIGIFQGGSLQMWRKFFGNKARIIGIDVNPEAKRFEKDGFEIFIGSQSDPNFWSYFFKKVGKVDIILDDGGHTNKQQVITAINCVKYINDNGKLVFEDVHTSYQKEFQNPSIYSFINYCKKNIDDINFRFPHLGDFSSSLNKYIHSITFFESIVCFNINKKLCKKNSLIINNGRTSKLADLRYGNKKYKEKLIILKKIPVINYFIKKLIKLKNEYNISKKFLKYFR
jgi:hypothetical protein